MKNIVRNWFFEEHSSFLFIIWTKIISTKMYQAIRLQIERTYAREGLLIALLFWVVVGLLTQSGIYDYKIISEQCEVFSKIETQKAQNTIKSLKNGFKGRYSVSYIIKPSPLIALSSQRDIMYIFFDNAEIVRVGNLDASMECNRENNISLLSLLSLIFLIGSIIWGYVSFKDKIFLNTLGKKIGFKKVFISISLSKIVILVFFLYITELLILGVYAINDIFLTFTEMLNLTLILTYLLVFLVVGTFTGGFVGYQTKKNSVGIFYLFITFICYSLLFPLFINRIANKNELSADASLHSLELRKELIKHNAENRIKNQIKENGYNLHKYNQMIDNFLKTDRKRIDKLDIERYKILERGNKKSDFINSLFPSTFYNMLCYKLTSYNFLYLYKKALNLHKEFVMTYYGKNGISHIKKDSYILKSNNKISNNLIFGILNSLLVFALFPAIFIYGKMRSDLVNFDLGLLLNIRSIPPSIRLFDLVEMLIGNSVCEYRNVRWCDLDVSRKNQIITKIKKEVEKC